MLGVSQFLNNKLDTQQFSWTILNLTKQNREYHELNYFANNCKHYLIPFFNISFLEARKKIVKMTAFNSGNHKCHCLAKKTNLK